MAHKYQTFAGLLYARVKRPDLSLEDVCLLDRIQKHLSVSAAAVAHLRREGLIEGRMPHLQEAVVARQLTLSQFCLGGPEPIPLVSAISFLNSSNVIPYLHRSYEF